MKSLSTFLGKFPLPEKDAEAFCADPLGYLSETGTTTEGLPGRVASLPFEEVRKLTQVRDLKALLAKHAIENGPAETDFVSETREPATESTESQRRLVAAPSIFRQSKAEPIESFCLGQSAEAAAAAPASVGLPFPAFREAFERREAETKTLMPTAESGLLEPAIPIAPPAPILDVLPDAGMATGRQLRQIIGGPGAQPEGATAEAIILADDRVQVTDTGANPFAWLCRLEITAGTGARWLGTGWFISPSVVVTAGHCVFIHSHGGWVQSIAVHVAQNGAQVARSFVSTNFGSTRGWVENRETVNDYGVIFAPPGDQGYFGYGVLGDGMLADALANVSGYPQDKPSGTLWGHVKRLLPPQPAVLNYEIDTFGGMSGAPVVLWDGQDYVAVGIHNYGDAMANTATRVTEEVFYNFERWKSIGATV